MTTTATIAPAKKARKPRKTTRKLPTVIDTQQEVVPDILNKHGVGHVPLQPVILPAKKEYLSGKSLWVHPDGTMYDAYDYRDPITERDGNGPYCTGHSHWASYFMQTSISKLEAAGWAHVSCGSIMIRRKMMTRRQQDALEMWALCNGYKGENFLDKAIQDIDQYFDENGNKKC